MFGFDARTRALLAALARQGTLAAAAREVGMDPSNARRHLRAAEARHGAPLVAATRGGASRGATRLRRAGRALLAPGLLARAEAYDAKEGVTPLRLGRRVLHAAGPAPTPTVRVAFRPEDVGLERPQKGRPARSVRNALPAVVERIEPSAEGTLRVRLLAGDLPLEARITRGALRELRLREGSRVVATLKATAIRMEAVRP